MPAKKKSKKKGDILARMTVDQRRQYLEKKAAHEQERNRRREELLAAFLKLKLQDEQKKAKMNEAKLNVKWREILRQVKSDSLMSQLENLNLWINERVHSQDKLIDLLMNSLEEASRQRTLASQKHLTFIQNMAALHEEHISLLAKDYREQETDLMIRTAEEIQRSSRQHIHNVKRLELTARAAVENTEDGEKQEFARFQDAVASVKAKLEEEAVLATDLLEYQLEEAWYEFATLAQKCEEQTRVLREECSALQDKVNDNMNAKDKVDRDLLEMQAEISMWRDRFSVKEKDMREEFPESSVDQALNYLRRSTQALRIQSRDSIKRANQVVDPAFEHLEETSRLGEEILQLSDLCRRQETTEDMNLPFLPSLPVPGIVSAITAEEGKQVSEEREIINGEGVVIKNTFPFLKKENFRTKIVESDSGMGSSNQTNSFQNERTLNHFSEDTSSALGTLSDKDNGGDKLQGPNISSALVHSEEETSKYPLPQVTLDRIHSLVMDENALMEIAEMLGQTKVYTTDYVMKETELLMRTHESLSHMWCKVNNVEVQRLSLMKEAEDLRQENTVLKDMLKNFFYSQGITNKSLNIPKAPMMVLGLSPFQDEL